MRIRNVIALSLLIGGIAAIDSARAGDPVPNPASNPTDTISLPQVMSRVGVSGGNVPELGGDGRLDLVPVNAITLAPNEAAILLNRSPGLKIAPPPNGGMYIGQYEADPGDIELFEEAIGRKVAYGSSVAEFPPVQPFGWDVDGRPFFDAAAAETLWQQGRIIHVFAYETIPCPCHEQIDDFTVDRLLNGDYDADLRALAAQFREFGKPMFFLTAGEANGVWELWSGGFGPLGDQDLNWAMSNEQGMAEFDPSGFPNAWLYADLGNPSVSDGVERLVAAQRYYHNFFVVEEGLDFLTFSSVVWAAGNPWPDLTEELGFLPGEPNYELIRTNFSFEYAYPGNEYVDWVSITFYIMDWNLDPAIVIQEGIAQLAFTMNQIRSTAPGMPVFAIEMGFPDGMNQDSTWAAEKVTAGLTELITNYPEIGAFAMWPDYWDPFAYLIRPNTAQGDAFRAIVDANPDYFHSCVYFSDGSRIPTCSTDPSLLAGDVDGSGMLDGADIAGFVRVKLGTPEPGDAEACADYGTGTLEGDVGAFVADLLSS